MKLSMPNIMFFVAAGFAVVAALIWFAFLRPVPVLTTSAVIRSKTDKPAGTYWQQQVGGSRGFRTAIPISIAASCVLELDCGALDSTGYFPVGPSEGKDYTIGQQLTIDYQMRGLPLIGYKITVLAIHPTGGS